MSVRWTLRSHLAGKEQIYRATDLRELIIKRTGVVISTQQLCNLLNEPPKMIRLSTIEILCSALNAKLSDFLEVTPRTLKPDNKRKLSFKNTPKGKIGVKSFPQATNYKK
jgi:DNA-binding Xre family transcriptional regulator